MTEIHGEVERGFEPVRDAFARNFTDHGEVGAAFSLYVRGRKVVDLWGGVADDTDGRPWQEDTVSVVFSTTKGATAVCAHLLAQRGELDLDAPVASYWPEFAAAGKEAIPVRWLLSHEAGLPVVDAVLTLDDVIAWEPVVEALAAQAPIWEPGTAHGYHAVTYGHLVGEVVRRIAGRSLGAFFAEEVAAPLGLDFWIGLPDDQQGRAARLVTIAPPADPAMKALYDQFMGPESLLGRALSLTGALQGEVFNDPAFRGAEVPAANGVTDARSLARMYAALVGEVDGVRILTPDQAAAARERQSEGNDRVLVIETRFGLGFMLTSPFSPYGGANNFGHPGAGGSVGWADPDREIGFGYVMNKMQQNLSGDARTISLIDAVYESLGEPVRAR